MVIKIMTLEMKVMWCRPICTCPCTNFPVEVTIALYASLNKVHVSLFRLSVHGELFFQLIN